ncbi:MAG: phosphatidylinositol transfer protein [Labilithrix sp.]
MGCSGYAGEADEATSSDLLTSLPACQPLNACEAPSWSYEPRGWEHTIASSVVTHLGDPHHRGRDMFYVPGEKQTVHAKFTYSLTDKDLHGEEVDVFVQRDCASGWEKLGTAVTTKDGEHPTVDGVADNGGRIYFEIPESKRLGPGRHRVRSVVAGDGTYADSFLDIVEPGTPIVVSDVDGTLTSSENVEYLDLLRGRVSETHEGAPQALSTLASKGYRVMYLTARPEILTSRTRAFLTERGFPIGVVHTSTNTTGAGVGPSAATYKSDELALLEKKGLVVTYGFGNRTTDADAYATVVSDPQHRVLYQLDEPFTGRRIESYTEIVPALQHEKTVCQ